MEWSPTIRRLLLRRVQVLSNEVLDAIHMAGTRSPVQRRAAVRIHGGAEAVLVFLQEGQVAGRRGVEDVGVLRCRLLTDHFKAAFCVWESSAVCEALRAERVDVLRAAFSMTRAAQNMLLLLAAEERCGPHSRVLCGLAGLLVP